MEVWPIYPRHIEELCENNNGNVMNYVIDQVVTKQVCTTSVVLAVFSTRILAKVLEELVSL